jgi:hypothetical protein
VESDDVHRPNGELFELNGHIRFFTIVTQGPPEGFFEPSTEALPLPEQPEEMLVSEDVPEEVLALLSLNRNLSTNDYEEGLGVVEHSNCCGKSR